MEAIIVLVIVAYLLFHHHHYRKRRRRGLSVWASIPGPFGTRIGKRFRL
jgi:hypothetical protein